MIKGDKDSNMVAYGDRWKYHVGAHRSSRGRQAFSQSIRVDVSCCDPLQDSVGVITPSSLHYVATTRGAFMPEIIPRSIV